MRESYRFMTGPKCFVGTVVRVVRSETDGQWRWWIRLPVKYRTAPMRFHVSSLCDSLDSGKRIVQTIAHELHLAPTGGTWAIEVEQKEEDGDT